MSDKVVTNLNLIRKYELRYFGVVLLSLVFFFIFREFFHHPSLESEQPYLLLIHTLIELFSSFITLTIFLQAVIIKSSDLKDANFFLGVVFLAVCSFSLLHTFSYQGMPFMDDAFSSTRSTWFWILGRLSECIGICLAVLFKGRLSIKYRKNLYCHGCSRC